MSIRDRSTWLNDRSPPGATDIVARPLGLAWPRDVFSLSHVAIPFPLSDPIYGRDEIPGESRTIRLGVLSPRGERAVFSVPSDTLMRLTCNPFFAYLDARLDAWISTDSERVAKFSVGGQ